MKRPDYRGHRGAVAGDDYHELWALRQSLKLLDLHTRLSAVTVEGLKPEDEKGVPADTWDGVDCTFYFGGNGEDSAERIVIDQVKYSAANRNRAWTISRLTTAKNKKKDNSVIARLGKAFLGLKKTRPDLVASGNVIVRLVSNQPVSTAVLEAVSSHTSALSSRKSAKRRADRKALRCASELDINDFDEFTTSLDLSECGGESRFAHEERVMRTISGWTEDDARPDINHLLGFIRDKMLPESKGEVITRESIFAKLGFSDVGALFPCPSEIEQIANLVPRQGSTTVVSRMVSGEQRICLHGEGGCGKTTALQEITRLLPAGSVAIVFDCYGGGRYLDSDAYRHRVSDAFLQLSNDLAQHLRVPLLVSRSQDIDYPRVFKKRLDLAAEVVAAESADALLVIIVDAADNSITASSTRVPPEKSFVNDFLTLGELPRNVRIVVTSRTGQLGRLSLPREFVRIEITGFAEAETAAYVRGQWREAPDDWIADFHYLSGGSPRVQRYAWDYAQADSAKALDYLRPNGKSLDQIFEEQLTLLRSKVGKESDIKAFCSGLIALPRPIPVLDIAAVTGLTTEHVTDLCHDLAPGIRIGNGFIGFADEEFERFLRQEAEAELESIRQLIAAHFLRCHKSDPYAASHVAAALLEANRGKEIIDLINDEREPAAIRDPVVRRETQLQRLRIAMKVCQESGNHVDAMMTMLVGAEALKTGSAISTMLDENPDLAVSFARDTTSRTILRDPDQIESHGPLLFQLMAADARKGDGISVRERYRQARAWMQRRADSYREQEKQNPGFHPEGWHLGTTDVAASIEAVIRIGGPAAAIDELFSWTPRTVALRVASILPSKLIVSGKTDLVEQCLEEVGPPWDLFFLTPLALAGNQIDLSRMLYSLAKLQRRRLIFLGRLREPGREENQSDVHLETVLSACEAVLARGGDPSRVIPILELFADQELRRVDRLATYQQRLIDLSLRAHTMLEALDGRKATIQSYLVTPPNIIDKSPKEIELSKKSANDKKDELTTFIAPFIELYEVRTRVLLGKIPLNSVDKQLDDAISRSHQEDYKLRNEYRAAEMRARAALALTTLTMVPTLDSTILLEDTCNVLENGLNPFRADAVDILDKLALKTSLHDKILRVVSSRAEGVKKAKASSEDKIFALVRFARLLTLISHSDASTIFNDAIAVAGEVNAEAIHEIALFAPLTGRAAQNSKFEDRRAVAHNFAMVASDVGIRLAGQENFPWTEVAQSLTTLDPCFALAATARWEDAALVSSSDLLPTVLRTGILQKTLSPRQVAAMLPLIDNAEVELLSRILAESVANPEDIDLNALVDDLSREELLRFGKGRRPVVSEQLNSLEHAENRGHWLDRLLQTTSFLDRRAPEEVDQLGSQKASNKQDADPFENIDWKARTFTTAKEINDVVSQVLDSSHASGNYLSAESILERIANAVAVGDRTAHLEALSQSASFLIDRIELAEIVVKLVERWNEVPSVVTWAREKLLPLVMDQLPGLSRWLVYRDSPLPALLKKSGAGDAEICSSLLTAMERHVDSLNAPTIYALVGLVGQYCTPEEALQVLNRYAGRLVLRIPVGDRDAWDLTDLPTNIDDGIARFLFALMGDADVRIRWLAAHAIRSLARLGDFAIVDKLVGKFKSRTFESTFRRPDGPFYWLAARLWLAIALERIATERPLAIRSHAPWLLEVATDETFPHFLIRSFAKSALSKLVESGVVELDASELETLQRANTTLFKRKKQQNGWGRGFNKYQYKPREARKFTFDTMDTLPHWYSSALNAFVDVDKEEFLDIAERWIVDRWSVRNDPWEWNAEPRRDRFSDRSYPSMSHRDGSLPTIERFHTYLEWHAMWCTIGELLRTHPLAIVEDDDYDRLERQLERNGLSLPPLWLADLRGSKPLETRFWAAPKVIDTWLRENAHEHFLIEVMPNNSDRWIVVDGHHETKSRAFRLTVRVESALVSPDSAAALVRALQTAKEHHYGIPKGGDEIEIHSPPYQLKSWLIDGSYNAGIDERDPLRLDINGVQCVPSTQAGFGLNLEFHSPRHLWLDSKSEKEVFVYDAWGESRWDDREDTVRYDEAVRSSGWRLRIDRLKLERFLGQTNFDLLFEIKLDRRNKGYYDYSRQEEKATESKSTKIVLFRQDGTIEDANGRVGTWTAPRS